MNKKETFLSKNNGSKISKVVSKNVYLSIGSNLSNRKKNIIKAVLLLDGNEKVRVIKRSLIYESEAWGYTRQKPFYNAVIKIETTLNPYELLKLCKAVERKMRRVKKFKWGPRTVDIDILIYKRLKIYTKKLTIPHKYITQRVFSVVPLAEIDKTIKLNGKKLNSFIDGFNEQLKPVD